MANTRDMTVGNPTKLILFFALPIVLGNIFQQLYSMVDTMVVGRVEGVEALAAVGGASWLDWLVLGLMIGFTQGFSILVAQRFGAGDHKGLRRAVTTAILLTGGIAVVVSILIQIVLSPMLKLMQFPENTIHLTEQYLRILFGGVCAVAAYNLMAGILRALGDSRTPLLAMVAAALTNIALDIVFVAVFHWGVRGVAIATVLAQCLSFVVCLIAVLRVPALHFSKEDWQIEKDDVKKSLRLGIPVAFQNMIIAVGGLVLQTIVNTFGHIFMAGFTAANRMTGILELAGTSLGGAMATFTGQNLGAGRFDRIRLGLRKAIRIAIGLAVVIGAAAVLFGKQIIRLFISDTPEVVEQVVAAGYPYLAIMASMLFVLYTLFMYRSTLQGLGDTFIPMLSGVLELFTRLGVVLTLRVFIGEYSVYFAEVSAWLTAAVLLIIGYYYRIKKLDPAGKAGGGGEDGGNGGERLLS